MADVARAAGTSVSTVSLALRNSPLISGATRRRVQEAAVKVGYVPDPHVAQLMSYLRRPSPQKSAGVLAYLTAFEPPEAWRSVRVWGRYHAGAVRRAAALGYKLEEFAVRSTGMTEKRLSRVLQARGIRGLVIAPLPEGTHDLDFEWEHFSAVGIGLSLTAPRLHRVVHHHFGSMADALQQVRARGYRRMALVLEPYHDARVEHHWSAAFLSGLRQGGDRDPALIFEHLNQPAEFIDWFRRYRPELLVADNLVAARILDQAGFRIPRDYAYVSLNLVAIDKGFAGIDQCSENIGECAVTRLFASLQQNECGVPAVAETILVPGGWVDGPSVPHRDKRTAAVVRPPDVDRKSQPYLSGLR